MYGYRDVAAKLGATSIGAILDDYAKPDQPHTYQDGQTVILAGVVASARTRTTKNNTLMCYVVLEDDTGSIEIVAFQRVLDVGGCYLSENNTVFCVGRISVRDEKDPQLMLDQVRPMSDLADDTAIAWARQNAFQGRGRQGAPQRTPVAPEKQTLWVKLPSQDDPAFHRLELILTMFPGSEPLVVYFEDSKKRLGARCLHHEALIEELQEMVGCENVVIR
jgi:DNA polymerase-3 subunit alpha